MIVRVRIVLPDRRVSAALSVSLIAHLLLISLVLAAGTIRGTSRPSRPAMMVRLASGQTAQSPQPASTAQQTREPEPPPKTESKPEPKPEPKPDPPKRTRADAPKTVATEPEQATARPEELEEVEEPPEPAPAEPEGRDQAGDGEEIAGELPTGPIPGGVAGLETDDPLTADWYVGLVVARLSNAWRQRPVLPAGSDPRRVVVGFTVQRDGRVRDVRVAVPSGYAPLDYSAMRAVSSIEKLPPLPRQYELDELSARFVFELLPPEDR